MLTFDDGTVAVTTEGVHLDGEYRGILIPCLVQADSLSMLEGRALGVAELRSAYLKHRERIQRTARRVNAGVASLHNDPEAAQRGVLIIRPIDLQDGSAS